jgi:hypothetical protein
MVSPLVHIPLQTVQCVARAVWDVISLFVHELVVEEAHTHRQTDRHT